MLLSKLLFPECAGLRVDRYWRDGATIHLQISLVRRWARCPVCGRRCQAAIPRPFSGGAFVHVMQSIQHRP